MNTEGKKLKISKLAVASVVLGLLDVCVLVLIAIIFPWDIETMSFYILFMGFVALVSIALAIIARVKIKKSNSLVTGSWLATLGIVAALASLALVWIVASRYAEELADRMICGSNLAGLGKALILYSNDYDGKYPIPNNWCDLLLQGDYGVNEEQFKCRGARDVRCNYAINPNTELASRPDMVLLFETKGGWNQYGGPELLTTDNHNRKGCNVLFNDLHIEFVKTEQLGQLKWKVEEGK